MLKLITIPMTMPRPWQSHIKQLTPLQERRQPGLPRGRRRTRLALLGDLGPPEGRGPREEGHRPRDQPEQPLPQGMVVRWLKPDF